MFLDAIGSQITKKLKERGQEGQGTDFIEKNKDLFLDCPVLDAKFQRRHCIWVQFLLFHADDKYTECLTLREAVFKQTHKKLQCEECEHRSPETIKEKWNALVIQLRDTRRRFNDQRR